MGLVWLDSAFCVGSDGIMRWSDMRNALNPRRRWCRAIVETALNDGTLFRFSNESFNYVRSPVYLCKGLPHGQYMKYL